MRIRQSGANTAGVWLSGYGASDEAFVGMRTPTSVGFYGNTGAANWRLYVDTTSGDLTVTGNAFKPGGGAWAVPSDVRLKKNIESVQGALGKLLQLHPVTYEWKEPEQQGNLTGTQVGFIAQELEELFPQWVCTHPEGYKALVFRGFEALTVAALQELKAENDALKQQLNELQTARA